MQVVQLSNDDMVKFFQSSMLRRKLVPIVGSGFTSNCKSRNGCVPDGEEFQNQMIDEICKHYKELTKQDFLDEGYKFSDIADEFFKRVPKQTFKTILRDRFTGIELDEHKLNFLKINWPYIYTLNIDDAIERNSSFTAVRPYAKLSHTISDLDCVFKMHGDVLEELKYEDIPNIIFSKEQYIKSLEGNIYILDMFQRDYTSNNTIFIGCSLNDELDLKYAISTASDTEPSGIERIYVTKSVPKGLRYSRLESFGITTILIVDDYKDLYSLLFSIYDSDRFSTERPYDEFKNPAISKFKKDFKVNKEYLLDVAGNMSSKYTLPFYFQKRSIATDIITRLEKEVLSVVVGRRFTGKTCLAKDIATSVSTKNIYFFPSTVSLSNRNISDLSKIDNAVIIFDSNVLTISDIFSLGDILDDVEINGTRLIVFVNKSDNIVLSALSRLTQGNYYPLEGTLSPEEVIHLNEKLSQLGIVNFDVSKSFLDNCYRYCDIYKEKMPINVNDITDTELILLIILASEKKAYSAIASIFGLKKKEIEHFIRKYSPFVDCFDTVQLEIHQHSGYKLIANSASWIFRILGEYQDLKGVSNITDQIYQIVLKLKGHKNLEEVSSSVIRFDNLNQVFYRKEKGSVNLIFSIYDKLESLLFDDGHYWLQRAKSILHLKRKEENYLRLASDYAKKSYYDSTYEKLRINATTTLALIYGRLASLTSYRDVDILHSCIEWYYEALQETQYNKRYIEDILENTRKKKTDIKDLCNYLLLNRGDLPKGLKKKAEYVINMLFQRNC